MPCSIALLFFVGAVVPLHSHGSALVVEAPQATVIEAKVVCPCFEYQAVVRTAAFGGGRPDRADADLLLMDGSGAILDDDPGAGLDCEVVGGVGQSFVVVVRIINRGSSAVLVIVSTCSILTESLRLTPLETEKQTVEATAR